MGSVGLLYVGAVLFINGLMLVGAIPGKSAGILNFFVGGMQIISRALIILGANGDQATIFGASGLYLFGFTYLYVAILQFTGISGEGLGWFSLFVTARGRHWVPAVHPGGQRPRLRRYLAHLGRALVPVLPGSRTGQDVPDKDDGLVHHLHQPHDRHDSRVPAAPGLYDTNVGYAMIVAVAAALSLGVAWILGRGDREAQQAEPARTARTA